MAHRRTTSRTVGRGRRESAARSAGVLDRSLGNGRRSANGLAWAPAGGGMAVCGQSWVSEPSRNCVATTLPDASACLAHATGPDRHSFFASVDQDFSLLTRRLENLEVDAHLMGDLKP